MPTTSSSNSSSNSHQQQQQQHHTLSPVKRPALGRRAVSSHTISSARTSPSTPGELPDAAPAQHKFHTSHKPHRPHVVGGAHRTHVRSYSTGRNLNKLGRLTSAQQLALEAGAVAGGAGAGRQHQRKKSAPPTPAEEEEPESPRGGQHVRWDGAVDDRSTKATSMKKNHSTPALARNTSGVLAKKALVTNRPQSSGTGKKKTVGFELAGSDDEVAAADDDDNDWEDTATQSPESTRRNSVAPSAKGSGENSAENSTLLVDPLTFVKRAYAPPSSLAASLPNPYSSAFAGEDHHHAPEDEDGQSEKTPEDDSTQGSTTAEDRSVHGSPPLEHRDFAARLLTPSHSAKAPPAMSSVSATAKPSAVGSLSRNASLSNIAAGSDMSRRVVSNPQLASANTPGSHTQTTSSSIEGGISRFIATNKNSLQASSRTDSESNTPSSFLPHYHPQTPPSPHRSTTRPAKTSPASRPPGIEPPSRTQQKLWLQRTATLNTSPPDSHGTAAAASSPSALDPAFIAAGYTRAGRGGSFDAGRGPIHGAGRSGGITHDSEVKHIRKAYEKTASELMVVQRFQSPTEHSFMRLRALIGNRGKIKTSAATAASEQRPSSSSALGKPTKSAPALTHLQTAAAERRRPDSGHSDTEPDPKQLVSKRPDHDADEAASGGPRSRGSGTDVATAQGGGGGDRPSSSSQHPHQQQHHHHHHHHHGLQRLLSTSDDAAHGGHATAAGVPDEELEARYLVSETEMMIRRMWESREVATSG